MTGEPDHGPVAREGSRCAHCGLAVRLRRTRRVAAGDPRPPGGPVSEPVFCCLGCALADQITGRRDGGTEPSFILARLGLALFLSMQVMGLSMVLYAGDPLAAGAGSAGATAADPLHLGMAGILRHLLLLLSTPVMVLLGWPVVSRGVADLRRRGGGVDTLIGIGALAAFGLSVGATLSGHGPVYFETACMTLVLLTLGRYLEARARKRAAALLRGALAAEPVIARVLRDGLHLEVAADAIRPGDVVRIHAGSLVPADGVVIGGEAGIDESTLCGEPLPKLKRAGDPVYAGTTSLDGVLDVRVTAAGRERLAARIADLLERARASRAPIERLADRTAAIFAPLAAAAALGAGLVWAGRAGPGAGVLTGLSVLLIACPCALGLATPLAIWTAIGRAARHGIIIREAETLERLAAARAVRFDKTGTLTDGAPILTAVRVDPSSGLEASEALAAAATLERHAAHPLARALETAADRSGAMLPDAAGIRIHPGAGVAGEILLAGGRRLRMAVGGREMLRRAGVEQAGRERAGRGPETGDERLADGPECFLAVEGRLAARFEFSEALRPGAARAVEEMRALGVQVEVLTGDPGPAAAALGRRLGVTVRGGLSPGDKVARIDQDEKTAGPILMVGEGLNDAPAAARAHVSVALGCGAEVTRRAADVALLSDDLAQVAWLVRLARRTLRAIRVNLFWAFLYNVALIPLAMAGHLQPILAALAMIGSSLFVVGNSLRPAGVEEAGADARSVATAGALPAEAGAR